MIIQWNDKYIQGITSDRVPEELWTEVRDIVQETGIKTIPEKKKCKKTKWLSEEALQIAVKIRAGKKQKNRTLNDDLPRSVGAQYATEEEWTNSSRKNEEAVSSVQLLSHVQLFITQ